MNLGRTRSTQHTWKSRSDNGFIHREEIRSQRAGGTSSLAPPRVSCCCPGFGGLAACWAHPAAPKAPRAPQGGAASEGLVPQAHLLPESSAVYF